jgi:hypothetical protein
MKMKMSNRIAMLVISATLLTLSASAQFAATGTTSVSVVVGAEASLQVNTATTNLTSGGTIFGAYTGTTSLTYKIRTTTSGGTGSITLEVTTDFAPAGGPSVVTPPTAGDALTYTCTAAAPGTACAGPLTSSHTVQTSVATFGANAHSASAGNAGSVVWSLTDDPTYATGTYAATVTFTISAA